MRKLATLAEIATVRTHPNADSLDLVTIRGWQVVAKRDEFKSGDPCVYVEIDSVLPEWPEFEFLRKSKFRIKTIKLRGELSQGIAFPISIIPGDAGSFNEGDDLSEVLDIKLYAPPIPACLAGDVEGKFPSFIPKTDCERIQNHRWLLEDKDRTWVATEKANGSSCTVFWNAGSLHVCSRNWELKESENNAYWIAAKRLNLAEKLPDHRMIALQGELVGPKIQGNPYKLSDYNILFFDAWHLLDNCYLDFYDKRRFFRELGVEMVPLIFDEDRFSGGPNHTISDVLKKAEGRSQIGPCEREGLVFLPVHEEHDPRIGRVAFKAISNKFLLKAE
jgi:RNA ligase (TIGR02306 family)